MDNYVWIEENDELFIINFPLDFTIWKKMKMFFSFCSIWTKIKSFYFFHMEK